MGHWPRVALQSVWEKVPQNLWEQGLAVWGSATKAAFSKFLLPKPGMSTLQKESQHYVLLKMLDLEAENYRLPQSYQGQIMTGLNGLVGEE